MQLPSLMNRLPHRRRQKLLRDRFWALTETNIRFLYNAAYKYCGNRFDAEDLVQEALTIALEKYHQLRDADKFKGWIFTILRHVYLRGKRGKEPIAIDRYENGLDYLSELSTANTRLDLTTAYEKKVEAESVQSILNGLPEKHKTVLILYYMEDQSYQEISEMLAVPIGTVMSRLSRAKQAMKKALLRDRLNQPEEKNIMRMHTKR